jgi:hypothetical protein
MHTQGMTLEEATAEFASTAGLDPDHARLEAVRGTWDPGYFGYTLGTPPPAIVARQLLAGGAQRATTNSAIRAATPSATQNSGSIPDRPRRQP